MGVCVGAKNSRVQKSAYWNARPAGSFSSLGLRILDSQVYTLHSPTHTNALLPVSFSLTQMKGQPRITRHLRKDSLGEAKTGKKKKTYTKTKTINEQKK